MVRAILPDFIFDRLLVGKTLFQQGSPHPFLAELPEGFRYGVQIRNPEYLMPDYRSMRENGKTVRSSPDRAAQDACSRSTASNAALSGVLKSDSGM